jgi:hypothetical protein
MTEILDKAKPLAQATGGSLRKRCGSGLAVGKLNLAFEPPK